MHRDNFQPAHEQVKYDGLPLVVDDPQDGPSANLQILCRSCNSRKGAR